MSAQNERDTQSTADFVREMFADPIEGEAFARAFLRAGSLSTAIDSLLEAREQAGLTQEEVARTLGTKQPAIARLEADTWGRLSLRRYLDFALACGRLPLITLAPLQEAIQYVLENPEKSLTANAFEKWRLSEVPAIPPSGNVSISIAYSNQQPPLITAYGFEPPQNAVMFRPDFLKMDKMRQYALEAKSPTPANESSTAQTQASARTATAA